MACLIKILGVLKLSSPLRFIFWPLAMSAVRMKGFFIRCGNGLSPHLDKSLTRRRAKKTHLLLLKSEYVLSQEEQEIYGGNAMQPHEYITAAVLDYEPAVETALISPKPF